MGVANISGNILTDSGTNLSSLVSGSGTTNYVSKFTSSSAIGNSVLYDNGTNVGLGTTNPNIGGYGANSRLLTIQGVSGSYGILELTSNSANADGSAIGRLDFGSDGQAANYKAISSIASFLSGSTSTKFGADLRFYTRADNAASGDPSERMRISTTGNVGIGATPTDFGSSYTVLDVYNGTIGGYLLARSPNVTGQISVDNNTAMYVQTRTNHPILFAPNNTERMRITSGGNVLIGTTTDNGNKLQVNGNSYLGTGYVLSNSLNATGGQNGNAVSAEYGGTSWAINLASLFSNVTISGRGLSVVLQILGLSDSSNGSSVLVNAYRGIGGTWVINTVNAATNGSTFVNSISGSGATITINWNTTAFGCVSINIINRG